MLLSDVVFNGIHPMPWLKARAQQGDAESVSMLRSEVKNKFVFNGGLLIFVGERGGWQTVAEFRGNPVVERVIRRDDRLEWRFRSTPVGEVVVCPSDREWLDNCLHALRVTPAGYERIDEVPLSKRLVEEMRLLMWRRDFDGARKAWLAFFEAHPEKMRDRVTIESSLKGVSPEWLTQQEFERCVPMRIISGRFVD
jgi:hypothetical protein